MRCNNVYCYWQAFGECCNESEEGHIKARPNTLDCPSSLRGDFEKQLYNLVKECNNLLMERNMKELIEIKKFIINQRIN